MAILVRDLDTDPDPYCDTGNSVRRALAEVCTVPVLLFVIVSMRLLIMMISSGVFSFGTLSLLVE